MFGSTVMRMLWLSWWCYYCHEDVMTVMRMSILSWGCYDCHEDVTNVTWMWRMSWGCYDCNEDVITCNDLFLSRSRSSAASHFLSGRTRTATRPTSRWLEEEHGRREVTEVTFLRTLDKERLKRLDCLPPHYSCSPNRPLSSRSPRSSCVPAMLMAAGTLVRCVSSATLLCDIHDCVYQTIPHILHTWNHNTDLFSRGTVGGHSCSMTRVSAAGFLLALSALATGESGSLRVWQIRECGSLRVWQLERVAVWECDSLRVWKFESVAVWECGSLRWWQFQSVEDLRVWKFESVAVWEGGSLRVWKIWECGSLRVWQFESVSVWECGSLRVSVRVRLLSV